MTEQPIALRLADEIGEDYCRCLPAYKDRGRTDPQCESCNTEDWRHDAAAELRRLHQHELANSVWNEKTEWVQQTAQPHELGMHRADVLRQRIDRLHSVNAQLLEALCCVRNMVDHPVNLAFIDAAIAAAKGEA